MPGNDWMLFHEVYGSYYQTVAKILSRAVRGKLEQKDIPKLVQQYAFAESWSNLTESLSNGDWPFLDENLETELMYEPEMPLTILQKRWLKSMLLDQRICLFLDPQDVKGLEDVEPLFRQEDIVYFDRYADGDPYDNADYISNFRMILTALRQNRWLHVTQRSRWGTEIAQKVKPLYLEYSPRDDKFRLHSAGAGEHTWPGTIQINLSRITECEVAELDEEPVLVPAGRKKAELILTDRRDLLERFMRLFCYLEKRTVPLEEKAEPMRYRVELYYEPTDEAELLIRLLGLGNDIEILSPVSLREKISCRIQQQKALFEKPVQP